MRRKEVDPAQRRAAFLEVLSQTLVEVLAGHDQGDPALGPDVDGDEEEDANHA